TTTKKKWLWPAVAVAALLVIASVVIAVGAINGSKKNDKPVAKNENTEEPRDKSVVQPPPRVQRGPTQAQIGEIAKFENAQEQVERIALSKDESVLVGGTRGGYLRVWSVESHKLIKSTKAHNDIVTSVVFSPKGDRVATASKDGTIKIWDISNEL